MSAQYALKVRQEQKRADEARDKADGLLDKLRVFQSLSSEKQRKDGKEKGLIGSDKMGTVHRLQKIDMETGLEPLHNPTVHFSPPDPAQIDLMILAEAKIDVLEKSNKAFTAQNADLQSEVLAFFIIQYLDDFNPRSIV